MSAKKSDEAIPLKVLKMAILMVNAADQCDQAGQWDRDHRRACQYILDWYGSNDYKITCDKAGATADKHGKMTNADRIRQMTDEELSDFLGGISDNCSYNTCDNCPMYGACVDVPLSRDKWLKQEVETDDER